MYKPQFIRSAIDAGDCVSNAWSLIKPNYWLFFGISLVTYLLIACIPCLNVFLMGPVMGGFYYTALRAMRGEPIDFGMMFKGFEKFLPLMVVGLIQSIPTMIYQGFDITIRFSNFGIESLLSGAGSESGEFDPRILLASGYVVVIVVIAFLLMVFSMIWAITFAFAVPIMMEQDLASPLEALKLSARASWSNVGGIILLGIFSVLLAFAGVLALCIGVFFVLPIVWVAWAFAYRQVFPLDSSYTPPNIMPPPPTAYGSGYGDYRAS